VDLIFVDIQMPGMTGLQFIESLTEKPMVILLTAYKQYALESYNLNVVDYLVKPVELKRFVAACNKAEELFQLKNLKKQPGNHHAAPGYMFVNADYSQVKVDFKNISYIEGLKDYLRIHLVDTVKPVITRMTFHEMEEQLPSEGFLRIHKSYIIALDSISSVRKNSVFIKDIEIPVGETYKEVITKLTGRDLE
jgi:two-component system, LytTR family, response regulator